MIPWMDAEDDYIRIYQRKRSITGSDMCSGHPRVFGDFVDYARNSLSFAQTPDYQRWRSAFRDLHPDLLRSTHIEVADTSERVGYVKDGIPVAIGGPLPPAELRWSDIEVDHDSYTPNDHWLCAYTLDS